MPTDHLHRVRLAMPELLGLFQWRGRQRDYLHLPAFAGLPADADVRAVEFDLETQQLVFLVEHPSFDAIELPCT
jgi:hypothetical protein